LERLRVIALPFRVEAPSQKIPVKTSPRNQQMLPGKWEDPDFEGQAYLANEIAKDRIGRLTYKPLPLKKN
jgi:hypothetical protein